MKNEDNSLKKNIAYNIIYQLIIVLLPLITSPYVSRALGAEMSGIYSFTYSIVYYFMMFGRLGIVNYGNRCVARVRDDKQKLSKTFWSLYIFQFIASIIVIILYITYIFTIEKNNTLILLIHLTVLVSNMLDITWFFFGIEDFKLALSRNILVRIITFVAILIFVKKPQDLWIYTFIMGGSTLIGQIIVWPFLKNRINFVRPTSKEVLVHLKPNLILFIPSIAISVFQIMDKIMLGYITKVSEVGYYEYAEKIISIPKAVITALGTAMLPRMSNLFAKKEEEKSKIYIRNTMFYVSIISSALSFGLMSVANVFAPVYWGKEFTASGMLIVVLAPSIIFSVIGNVIRTQYLIPKSRDKEYVISLVMGAIVNFIGNIILIPKYGAIGASINTVLAEIVMTGIQLFVVRNEINLKEFLNDGISFYIIGLCMFLILTYISKFMSISIISLIILIILGIIIYITFSVIYILISNNFYCKKIKNIIKEFLTKDRETNSEN